MLYNRKLPPLDHPAAAKTLNLPQPLPVTTSTLKRSPSDPCKLSVHLAHPATSIIAAIPTPLACQPTLFHHPTPQMIPQ